MDKSTDIEDNKLQREASGSKLAIFGILSAGLVLTTILLFTSPEDGPTTIVAALICLFVLSLSIINTAIIQFVRLVGRADLKQVQSFYLSLLVSTGVVFIVGLQTLGQLEISDVILTAVFVLILGFYILRRL